MRKIIVICLLLSLLLISSVSGRMAEARTTPPCWRYATLDAIDVTCKSCGHNRDHRARMTFNGKGWLVFNPADIAGCVVLRPRVIVNERLGIYRLETTIRCPSKGMEIRIFLYFLCCNGVCEKLGSGTVEVWRGINTPADPITEICNLKWYYNLYNEPTVDLSEIVREILNS